MATLKYLKNVHIQNSFKLFKNENFNLKLSKVLKKNRSIPIVMASNELLTASKKLEETQEKIDRIMRDGMRKLSMLFGSFNNDEDSKYDKLKSLDLKGFAEYILTCKKIIFINGAGISTSAGIPDFRSPKTGLYENLEKYTLPNPQLIFDIDYFKENPNPFFSFSKELLPQNYNPTLSHYFQRFLVDKGLVKKIYTQNIDGLESIAKIPDDKVVYGHGSFKTGHCLSCWQEYSFEWMKKTIYEKNFLKCENEKCLKSSSEEKLKIVKPDIVFFGERMPEEFLNYKEDFNDCDCLIIMGTSLKVHPFSMLPNMVKRNCPRLLINRDRVGDWELYESDPELNKRDVLLLGGCDDGVLKLVDQLGWRKDFDEFLEKEKNLKNQVTSKVETS